jgi:membrane protein implicated in regulation of membrane protease activity
MIRLALALLAFAILSAVAVLIAGRRRRRRAGEIRVDPLPAGLKQLASHVGALSSFGMGLRLPPHGVARRRVGTLIGVR